MQPSCLLSSAKRNRSSSSPSESAPRKRSNRLTTTPPPTSPQDDVEMGDASTDGTSDNPSAAALDSQSSGDSQAVSDLSSSAAPPPNHHRSAAVSASREQATSSLLSGSAGSSRHDALNSLRSDLSAFLPCASSSTSGSASSSSSSDVRAPPRTPQAPLERVQDTFRRDAISSASGLGSLGRIEESFTQTRDPTLTRASRLGVGNGTYGGPSGFGVPAECEGMLGGFSTRARSYFGGAAQEGPSTKPGLDASRPYFSAPASSPFRAPSTANESRGRNPLRTTPPPRRRQDLWEDTPGAPSASDRRSSAFSARSSARRVQDQMSSPTRGGAPAFGLVAAPGRATGFGPPLRPDFGAAGVQPSGRNADGSPSGPSKTCGKKAAKKEKSRERWEEDADDSDDEMED